MQGQTIVARFHDYGAAHRAFCELIQSGVRPDDISIIAGDHSNRYGANRDFGILTADAERYLAAVLHGMTLLAVRARDRERTPIAEIIEQHMPSEIAAPALDHVAEHADGDAPHRPRRALKR